MAAPANKDLKLNPQQQRIAEFVKTASKEPPKYEIGDDLNVAQAMAVPDDVVRGPEYAYAWLAIDGIEYQLSTGTKWELVTRVNHSHVPDRYFGLDGAITYKGQNILAFCLKAIRDKEDELIVRRYNAKTDRVVKKTDRIKEGEVACLGDIKQAGKMVQSDELTPNEKYDYAEP